MARPNGNGIISLHDDKETNHGFFCMKLVSYLNEEAEMGTDVYEELWHERFAQAKAGKSVLTMPNQNRHSDERESKDNTPSRERRCSRLQCPDG